MKDLISRAAAIDALIRKMRPHDNGDGTITIYIMSEELVRETLNDLPSAQPEIIRCEDCKHYEADIMGNPWGVCCHKDWVIDNCGSLVDEKGWCYRAKRRTDDT